MRSYRRWLFRALVLFAAASACLGASAYVSGDVATASGMFEDAATLLILAVVVEPLGAGARMLLWRLVDRRFGDDSGEEEGIVIEDLETGETYVFEEGGEA